MEQPNTPNTFISSDKAKYLWATLLIIAWTGLAILFRYPERGDVLQKCLLLTTPVYLLWYAIGLLSINYLATWPHRILFATSLLLLAWLALYQINWRPDGLIRTPPPWQQWHIPDEPQQKAAYDLAHSLKTPDDFKDDGFYQQGLFGIFGRTTATDYLKHLCDSYAGEFVYKRVTGVAGLYEMRPRQHARQTEEFSDLYRMEDPYGYHSAQAAAQPFEFVAHPHANYDYFETVSSPSDYAPAYRSNYKQYEDRGLHYWYYSGYSYLPPPKVKFTVVNKAKLQSRYGFTWRGLRVPYDRENGIAGGELLVVDLKSNEVLAMRRGFAFASRISNNQSGISWEWAYICPMPLNKKGEPKGKGYQFEYDFIKKYYPHYTNLNIKKPINSIKKGNQNE